MSSRRASSNLRTKWPEIMQIKAGEDYSLENFIKYCLGYIGLINPAFSRYRVFTEPLDGSVLDPEFIFNLDVNETDVLPINLTEFYGLNPNELNEETERAYFKQKALAQKIEEIKNKYKVNEYTKQITLNFGYFKVEIREDESLKEEEDDDEVKKPVKPISQYYPLFSLPIGIFLRNNKYYNIKLLDSNIMPNLGFLQNVLETRLPAIEIKLYIPLH